MGAQRAEIDRLTSDHGLHHIDQTFQRVDSQVWRKGFETVQDFVRLETGRFWSRHTLRTLPLLLPDREEVTSSVFPHWERLDKGVRYRGFSVYGQSGADGPYLLPKSWVKKPLYLAPLSATKLIPISLNPGFMMFLQWPGLASHAATTSLGPPTV